MSAKIHKDIFDILLNYPNNCEMCGLVFNELKDSCLRKWATNKELSGNELRENIFQNLQNCSDAQDSLMEYVLLCQSNPDFALGYLKPDTFEFK